MTLSKSNEYLLSYIRLGGPEFNSSTFWKRATGQLQPLGIFNNFSSIDIICLLIYSVPITILFFFYKVAVLTTEKIIEVMIWSRPVFL